MLKHSGSSAARVFVGDAFDYKPVFSENDVGSFGREHRLNSKFLRKIMKLRPYKRKEFD